MVKNASLVMFVVILCSCSSYIKVASPYDNSIDFFNLKIGSMTYTDALLAYGPPSNSTLYYDSTVQKRIRTSIWNFGGSGQVSTTVASVYGITTANTYLNRDRLLKLGFINDTLRTFDISNMNLSTDSVLVLTKKSVSSQKGVDTQIRIITAGVVGVGFIIGLLMR